MKYNIRVKIAKESNNIIYYDDKINNIKFKESLLGIKCKNLNTGEKATVTRGYQLRDELNKSKIKFIRDYGIISYGTSILDRLTKKEIILRGCYEKINDFCAVENCGDHYVAYTVHNSALIKYYIDNTISVDAIYDEIINKGKCIYREDHYFRTDVVNNRLVGSKLSYRKECKFSSKIINDELEVILVPTIRCKYNIDENSMTIFISYTFNKDKNKKVSFETNKPTSKFYISQSSVSSNYMIDCLNIDNPDIDDYLIIKADSNKIKSNDIMRVPIPKNSFIAVSENSKKKYSDIYIHVDQMCI